MKKYKKRGTKKGHKNTKEHNKNISLSWDKKRRQHQAKFAKSLWTIEFRKKVSNFMKKRKISKSTLKKLKPYLFKSGKKNIMFGKHYKMSKEHKRKIGESQEGSKNHQWRGGKIKRICKICKKIFYVKPSQIKWTGAHCCSPRCNGLRIIKFMKTKNTSIEIAIEKELLRYKIKYEPQAIIENIAVVDFLLPDKTIIQCDGTYWHNKPKVKKRDKKQDKLLCALGYRIFRFSDKEIEKSPKKCLEKIYGELLSV